MSLPARFWSKVDRRGSDECWPWLAAKVTGYGRFRLDGRQVSAHVASYENAIGPVPPGLKLDHTCHNLDRSCSGGTTCQHRGCVNPAHLEAVTPRVNLRRSVLTFATMNGEKTHCNNGHEYAGANLGKQRAGRACRACSRERTRRYRERRYVTATD